VQCIDDACVYTILANGQPSDDAPGDCQSYLCDGADGFTPVDDPDDLPDDGNSCTVDVCGPEGPAHAAVDPGTACDGGYCHADLSCKPCAERETCEDGGAEPNQTQSNAFVLSQVSDADGIRYQCEALGSADDVDWFTFDAIDSVLGKVAPTIVVDPEDLEVCAYFQCKNAGTAVVCPDGTVADNSPLGPQGCCGHGSFAPYIDCKGIDEDASVWIAVRRDPELPDPPTASTTSSATNTNKGQAPRAGPGLSDMSRSASRGRPASSAARPPGRGAPGYAAARSASRTCPTAPSPGSPPGR
jgi:hypothetical protein